MWTQWKWLMSSGEERTQEHYFDIVCRNRNMSKTSSNQVHVMHWSMCARWSVPFGLVSCISIPWLWFWNLDCMCWTPDPTCGISVTPVHCFSSRDALDTLYDTLYVNHLGIWFAFPRSLSREKLQDCCASVQVNALAFEKSSDLPRFSVCYRKLEFVQFHKTLTFGYLLFEGSVKGSAWPYPPLLQYLWQDRSLVSCANAAFSEPTL